MCVGDVESSCLEGADGLSAQPEEVPSDEARHWKGTHAEEEVVRAAQARD